MVSGFTKDNKFHPTNPYIKKGTRMSRDQSTKTQGVQVIRKKRFVPKVTVQKHGSGNNFNYTVNLAGRGMYVVGTKKEAEELAEGTKESVQIHLKNGAIFDKEGYVVDYDKKKAEEAMQ